MAGKRLPDSELELMMIIWDAEGSVTRSEIEDRLPAERKLSATTVLSFLSRLQEKGFLEVERDGKTNRYRPLVEKETYLREESRSIWKRLYQNSVGNFMTALGSGEELSDRDLDELQEFLDRQRRGRS
ncbi:BlaI/MecI/CopY family transcriptional regulator [Anaerosacchariphilus sp. NSJ-68]|uniref:BlaI/MecI/CopY family transcriptional regulator n=2 Tax=Lachnospiraceae TaxID=186803 RepID=A0A923RL47_9FIRM|nr:MULTISPECIES: BlaI/MecI/CopY family transcriptional regulator [Lachnospiraceae]MBC5658839.1 BlaI/MecI/CopY family transcriptional regulator [Anaerosacchariphilus hominis]MBC5698892.1 BlaI/MecI/CopY family transcriptional regulator [Roseburia difficilis]